MKYDFGPYGEYHGNVFVPLRTKIECYYKFKGQCVVERVGWKPGENIRLSHWLLELNGIDSGVFIPRWMTIG